MEKTQTFNAVFFYLFLPIIIALSLILGRLYNSHKNINIKKYQLTQGLIIGNIFAGIIGILVALFLYAYTLNLSLSHLLQWEFLTLSIICLLSLIGGIGIGAHLAGVSIEKTLRGKLSQPEFKNLSKTVHHFHANLGHRLPFTSLILITYTLTLLDLFKGTTAIMKPHQVVLSTLTGIILGTLFSFIFIITYTSKLMSKITLITLISIALASTNEARNLIEHPVAFIFTIFYSTIVICIEAKKYLPRNLILNFIKISQSLFKWDGIILHPDHEIFRKIKSQYYRDNNSNKS